MVLCQFRKLWVCLGLMGVRGSHQEAVIRLPRSPGPGVPGSPGRASTSCSALLPPRPLWSAPPPCPSIMSESVWLAQERFPAALCSIATSSEVLGKVPVRKGDGSCPVRLPVQDGQLVEVPCTVIGGGCSLQSLGSAMN